MKTDTQGWLAGELRVTHAFLLPEALALLTGNEHDPKFANDSIRDGSKLVEIVDALRILEEPTHLFVGPGHLAQ